MEHQHWWMNHQNHIGLVAALVVVASYAPYVQGMLRGTCRPNRVSWAIWALLGGLSFVAYVQGGGDSGLAVPALAALGPLTIAALSLRFGVGGASRGDVGTLVGCLVGLGAWAWTDDPALALGIAIVVDLLAAVPTLRKSWSNPESESLAAWSMAFAGSSLNLFALDEWTPVEVSYPLYLAVVNGAVATALVAGGRRRLRLRRSGSAAP